jgi:putative ABC transport system substrate-binding protein
MTTRTATRRRRFLAASAALLAAPFARAQPSRALPALGILSPNRTPTPQEWAAHPPAVALAQLGWIDGQTIALEFAYAGGREDRLAELAGDLVRRRVDLIWARGPEAAVAAARATQTIPIVFGSVPFPVELGLVDTLARPGRNATGVAFLTGDGQQTAKCLEYLRELAPDARRLGSIYSAHNLRTLAGEEYRGYVDFDQSVRDLGFELRREDVAGPADYDAVFAELLEWQAQALLALSTPLNWRERARIADFARRNRLPSAHDTRAFVEAGGLVSFGPVLSAIGVQCMRYVDRILRGARPAELAVEQPTKTEMAVNLVTARALGLTVPQSLLLRADHLIGKPS